MFHGQFKSGTQEFQPESPKKMCSFRPFNPKPLTMPLFFLKVLGFKPCSLREKLSCVYTSLISFAMTTFVTIGTYMTIKEMNAAAGFTKVNDNFRKSWEIEGGVENLFSSRLCRATIAFYFPLRWNLEQEKTRNNLATPKNVKGEHSPEPVCYCEGWKNSSQVTCSGIQKMFLKYIKLFPFAKWRNFLPCFSFISLQFSYTAARHIFPVLGAFLFMWTFFKKDIQHKITRIQNHSLPARNKSLLAAFSICSLVFFLVLGLFEHEVGVFLVNSKWFVAKYEDKNTISNDGFTVYLLYVAFYIMDYWAFVFFQTSALFISIIFISLTIHFRTHNQELRHLLSSSQLFKNDNFLKWKLKFSESVCFVEDLNEGLNLYLGFVVLTSGFGVLVSVYITTLVCEDSVQNIPWVVKFILPVLFVTCPAVILGQQVGWVSLV